MTLQTNINQKQAEIKKEEIEAIREQKMEQYSQSDYDTEINDNVSDVPVNVDLPAN